MEVACTDINITYSYEQLNDLKYMVLINEMFKTFFESNGRFCDPIFDSRQLNQIRFLGTFPIPSVSKVVKKHMSDPRVYSMDRLRTIMFNILQTSSRHYKGLIKGFSIDDDIRYSFAHLDDLEYLVFINELFRNYFAMNQRYYVPIFDTRQYCLVRDIIRYGGRNMENMEEVYKEPNMQKINFFLNNRKVACFDRIQRLMLVTSKRYIEYVKESDGAIPITSREALDLFTFIKRELPDTQNNEEEEESS